MSDLLSPHFTLSEFIKSNSAIRLGIKNSPSAEHLANMKALCVHVLEPIREHFRKPMTISSGYRSPALNAKVGGRDTSQHSNGEAADFEIVGVTNLDVARWIVNTMVFDQCVLEFYDPKVGPNSGWVHVSYNKDGPNRKQALTATSVNGKTKYTPGLPK